MAHYLDKNYNLKSVLLALRNTYGVHTGEEQKHHLYEVLREFKVITKIGYFMADNASNNDAALALLAQQMELNPVKQRLRCSGHIINLVCKAILYGVDNDAINEAIHGADNDDEADDLTTVAVTQFESVLRGNDQAAIIRAWRKKGPLGKLHNIIIHARWNPQRRALFKAKQREAADSDAAHLFELVINGGIRWNSAYDMLERAFKLKDAIDLYTSHYRGDNEAPLEDDALSNDDWHELSLLKQLLKPMKKMSLLVQSADGDCQDGALHEALRSTGYLLDKFETLKQQQQFEPRSPFKAMINLGWKKLNKYYALSDQTPVYRLAVLLHPRYKMAWFKLHRRERKEWMDEVMKVARASYNAYELRYSDEVLLRSEPASKMSDFETLNAINDDLFILDDLERWLQEPVDPDPSVDPLQWWKLHQHRFPVLRCMAFDHLAAPASSSADECTFSSAGHVLDEDHWHTSDELAEAYQLLKSWYHQDVLDKQAIEAAVMDTEAAVMAATPLSEVPATPVPPLCGTQTTLRSLSIAQSMPN